MRTPQVKLPVARRFAVQTAGELAEVIDTLDGRPVCAPQEAVMAELYRDDLNAAVVRGPHAVIAMLSDEPESPYDL